MTISFSLTKHPCATNNTTTMDTETAQTTTETIVTLLQHINHANNEGMELLYYFVYMENVSMVRLLLDRKNTLSIDVNDKRSQPYKTALNAAIMTDNCDLSAMLLFHGADPNIKFNRNHTPLYHAILKSNVGMLEMLIQHGAKIDVIVNGQPLLIHAIKTLESSQQELYTTQFKIVQMLLTDKTANHKDKDDQLPIHYAIISNDMVLFQLLLCKTTTIPTNILMLSIECDNEVMFEQLYKKMVVPLRNDQIYTIIGKSIRLACQLDCHTIVVKMLKFPEYLQYLLSGSGSYDSTWNESRSAYDLYDNISQEFSEFFEHIEKSYISTPLMEAIIHGSTNTTQELLKYVDRMDMSTCNQEGHNCLSFAIMAGNTPVAKALLDNNVSIDVPSKEPMLYHAIKAKSMACVKLLLHHHADPMIPFNRKSMLVWSIKFRQLDILKELLRCNVDVNQGDSPNIPIQQAVLIKDTRFLNELLEANAKRYFEGWHLNNQPIHMAINNINFKNYKLLMRNHYKGRDYAAIQSVFQQWGVAKTRTHHPLLNLHKSIVVLIMSFVELSNQTLPIPTTDIVDYIEQIIGKMNLSNFTLNHYQKILTYAQSMV